MRRAVQYGIFWVARLFTGLLLAGGGCSALLGLGAFSQGSAGPKWMGFVLTAGGAGIVVAAFVLDRLLCRAIRRWNSLPRGQGGAQGLRGPGSWPTRRSRPPP